MRGNEYRDTVNAINKTLTLKHFRAETVQRTIGQILAYLGAARIHQATQATPDGVQTRTILAALDHLDVQAHALHAITPRVETAEQRAGIWSEILETLTEIAGLLETERRTAAAIRRMQYRTA